MRHDYSFDLETLGTGRDSYILSIGCAKFDIMTGEILDTFYSKTRCGDEFKIDFDTVAWWMKQDHQVKKDLFSDYTDDIQWVLNSLRHWLEDNCIVWGNGATFDIALLEDAYRLSDPLITYDLKIPWHYRNIRDVRTVVDLASLSGFDKKKVEREGTHHNALDDAIHQAKLVSESFRYLRATF